MRKLLLTLTVIAACTALIAGMALAMSPEEMAKETEAAVAATAVKEKTKPATIMAKIDEGCALVKKEGEAAFAKFQGKGSPFLFRGTYIWIHALESGKMLMHPIKFKLNGKQLLGLKDKKGKRFFVTMNKVVKEGGAGWVQYYWPIPGKKEVGRKVSYVKGCKMPNGKTVVLGSGIYDYMADPGEMKKLKIH